MGAANDGVVEGASFMAGVDEGGTSETELRAVGHQFSAVSQHDTARSGEPGKERCVVSKLGGS